jgi:hypothetical protein
MAEMAEKLGRAEKTAEKSDKKTKHLESENHRLMQILADQEAELSSLRGQRDAALTKLRRIGGGGSATIAVVKPAATTQPRAPPSCSAQASAPSRAVQQCDDQDVAILGKLHARMEELSLQYGTSQPVTSQHRTPPLATVAATTVRAQTPRSKAGGNTRMEVRSPTAAAV